TPQLYPNIAAVGSNAYIVWTDNVNTGGSCLDGQAGGYCGKIFFSRSTNGGASFSAPVNLSSGAPLARNDRVPIIAASGTQVHVFWTDDQLQGEVFYRRSTDSGANFAAEVQLAPSDSFYSRPTGAFVDSGGNVHLAYYDSAAAGG